MKVYIAEKPSLGKKVAEALGGGKSHGSKIQGNNWIVTWCFGHLYETAAPSDYDPKYKNWCITDLPIIPSQWFIKPSDDKKEQIKVIKDCLNDANTVINVGDPDREGQLLIDELLDELNWNGETLRLWPKDLNESGLKKSLANCKPNSEYLGLKISAETRQRSDWLVGMNLTRLFSLLSEQAGVKQVLSVGRVQTPTLAIVVNRDREIENFKPVPYYTIKAIFENDGNKYIGVYQPLEKDLVEGKLQNETLVKTVESETLNSLAEISSLTTKPRTESPPLPFALSELQIICSKKHKMSAKDVLTHAQSLYEKHELTTYPRTDCGYLEDSSFLNANDILRSIKKIDPNYDQFIGKTSLKTKPKCFNDEKTTAHTGIIPTGKVVDLSKLNSSEKLIFDLICKRYIAQFMGSHNFDETKILTKCNGHSFKSSGKVITQNGWKEIEPPSNQKSTPQLPSIDQEKEVRCVDTGSEFKKTKPPSRFTDGELIKAMINAAKYIDDKSSKEILKASEGIGEESTRADIIENIVNRSYISVRDNKLISTPKGRSLIDCLPTEITDPIFTAQWEQKLKSIEESASTDKQEIFINELADWVTNIINTTDSIELKGAVIHKCDKCETGFLNLVKSKNGEFFGCSNYPECKNTKEARAGRPVESPTCPTCKEGKLQKRKGQYGDYFACNNYPTCKGTFKSVGGKPQLTQKPKNVTSYKCAETACTGHLVKRQGKKPWYGCNEYPKCKFTSQDKGGKPIKHGGIS